MKLIAHVIDGHQVDIRPAPVNDWMEATNQRFAYRCLPLNIASAYGWEVLCNASFLAMWTGGSGIDAIVIEPEPGTIATAVSHFGHGILHLPSALPVPHRARRGLMVQGPINRPKDGIAALCELDIHPAGYAGSLREGRALLLHLSCELRRAGGARVQLEVISADPGLKRQHMRGRRSARFNIDLKQPGSDAQSDKWQKLYIIAGSHRTVRRPPRPETVKGEAPLGPANGRQRRRPWPGARGRPASTGSAIPALLL